METQNPSLTYHGKFQHLHLKRRIQERNFKLISCCFLSCDLAQAVSDKVLLDVLIVLSPEIASSETETDKPGKHNCSLSFKTHACQSFSVWCSQCWRVWTILPLFSRKVFWKSSLGVFSMLSSKVLLHQFGNQHDNRSFGKRKFIRHSLTFLRVLVC